MRPTNYLTGSLLVVQCAVVSGRILVVAHNHTAVALAWLSATAFFLCSALSGLCFRRTI